MNGRFRSTRAPRAGSRRLVVTATAFAVLGLVGSGVVGSAAVAVSARPQGKVANRAACSRWNVTGTWRTLQSNQYSVTWTFVQTGTRISGSAVLPQGDAARGGYTGTVGHVTGSLVGSRLAVVVQWPRKTDGSLVRGEYVGTITPTAQTGRGQVTDGQAWDLANPGAKASWTGNGSAKCGGTTAEQVKVFIKYHANNLLTAPPLDGGQCPGASLKAARVIGTITAQITPNGDYQGGGDVADFPHLSRCRVPVIKFAVDHVALDVISPGKILQVALKVHIDQEGVHRPGQCKVGTTGTIVATYDDTTRAANSLRNDHLQIGPWASPCDAHNHVITNNITSITAYSSSSTWVSVDIGCSAPGTGIGPRNCT